MNAQIPIVVAVDDEPETLASLRRLFRHEPYDFWTTSRPLEALDWVTERPVRLLICDQRMANASGSEILEAVRHRSPGTIRVMLTGYPDRHAIGQRVRFDIQQLFTKPWEDASLRRTLRRLLEGARGLNADLRAFLRPCSLRAYDRILDALDARSTGLVVYARGMTDAARGLVQSAIASDMPVSIVDRSDVDVVGALEAPVREPDRPLRFLMVGLEEIPMAEAAGTLETLGHGGRIASGAMDAVHLLIRESFDMAVVDPCMDGLPMVLEAAGSVPVACLTDPADVAA